MTHIQVAASKGMKAGFNQRKRTIQRGGLKVRIGSFSDYCKTFGPEVTSCIAQMKNKPRTAPVTGVQPFADEPTGLTEEILAARERLAQLEAQLVEESTPKPVKRTRKAASTKENLWREWAVRKHNIPTTVGATFAYKGKRRTTTFEVTRITSEGVYTKRAS